MPAVLLHGVLSCKPSLHFLPAKPKQYVALSESLRDTIHLMNLINEFKDHGLSVTSSQPRVFCKAFEDNSGALELAAASSKDETPTKHINIKYHHFREHICLGLIEILPISTSEQLADIFTKPLAHTEHAPFSSCLRKALAAALLASSHGCFINSYWLNEGV
jgi:hypothetical protein